MPGDHSGAACAVWGSYFHFDVRYTYMFASYPAPAATGCAQQGMAYRLCSMMDTVKDQGIFHRATLLLFLSISVSMRCCRTRRVKGPGTESTCNPIVACASRLTTRHQLRGANNDGVEKSRMARQGSSLFSRVPRTRSSIYQPRATTYKQRFIRVTRPNMIHSTYTASARITVKHITPTA